jgi:hypothetical protein
MPDGRLLYAWDPSASHSSGPQSDSRLDDPISFWGAGIPLREVFDSVTHQTGVRFDFFPPGDANERVCVNLYLDPDRPPNLRELMAQLSWVLDCTFAYCRGGGDEQQYILLSTSASSGAEERLWAEKRTLLADMHERLRQQEERTSAVVAGKLVELTDALALSPEEAIARYRGTDDLLLLAALTPAKRRVAHLILGLPHRDLERFLDEGELHFNWEDLTPELRDALRQHFAGPDIAAAIELGCVRADEDSGWDPSGELRFTTVFTGARHGFFVIRGEFWSHENGEEPALVLAGEHVRLVSRGQHPEETMALLRALGEVPDPDRIESMYEEASQARRERRRELRQGRDRKWLRSRLSIHNVKSSEVRDLLVAFRFPGSRDASYPLWAVQEAVAAGTGMHVVSDCFSQPRRSIAPFLELAYDDEATHLTGLLALKLWSLSAAEGRRRPTAWVHDETAGWQWGDAGSFLRFRSLARDLWRASLLPEEILGSIDADLAPYVKRRLDSQAEHGAAAVARDYSNDCWVMGALTDAQLHLGGKIVCADPLVPANSYAHTLRETLLGAVAADSAALRFLCSLSDSQWELLRGPGLRWHQDLSSEQRAAVLDASLVPFLGEAAQAVVLLREAGPPADDGRALGPTIRRADELVVRVSKSDPDRGRALTEDPTAGPGLHTTRLPRELMADLRSPARLRDALRSASGR